MDYYVFAKELNISRRDICREVFERHRTNIRIKKEKTRNKNLWTILDTALKISNEKGFQAMSMRDLSRETGLSMGALYSYFSGKDELLAMLQETGMTLTRRVLAESQEGAQNPWGKLRAAIHAHLFLSEAMQPWFFFSYMETKNLSAEDKKKAKIGEMETEKLYSTIIAEGIESGSFADRDPVFTAAAIKAMLQDWYLKRWKYSARNQTVDEYAGFVVEFVSAYISPGQPPRRDHGSEHH